MSARRTERLLNLVICLLGTRRWLTKEQIRTAVPQYAQCETAEAFDRMFERDKEDLRELGVPVVTGSSSSWFEDEVGYRIDRDAYALPELELSAEELAVLGLASRVWQQASLAGPATRALVKLRALGIEADDHSLVGVEPRVRTAEPAFEPVYAATRDRCALHFTYRKPNGAVSRRRIEPWAVTNRSGHWYVVGFDRDRKAARVFRLSRIEGMPTRSGRVGAFEVPSDLDLSALVAGSVELSDDREALVVIRPGRGGMLRRRGRQVGTVVPPEPPVAAEATDATDAADRADGAGDFVLGAQDLGARDLPVALVGWDLLAVRVGDVRERAEELAGYGPDVVVLEPPDLRSAVARLLRSVVELHPRAAGSPGVEEHGLLGAAEGSGLSGRTESRG